MIRLLYRIPEVGALAAALSFSALTFPAVRSSADLVRLLCPSVFTAALIAAAALIWSVIRHQYAP